MRKLLLTLVAMIVTAFAFNISAETTTVYVVGAGDGLTWDLPGKAYSGENGVVSFTVNNLTKFKASLNNATAWDDEGGYNAGCYGPGATSFGNSVYPNGQTLPMVSWGEDIDLPWTGNYTITMDFNNNQITAKTSTPQPTTAPDVYIRGGMNGWAGTPTAWKFTNTSWTGTSGEWSFTGTIPAGQEFKIADSSWGAINYTLNNTNLTPVLDSPYNAIYNGGNTKLATAFTGTVTLKITNYSGHVATITFSEGNGGTVTPSYPSKLYIIGTINGDGWNPENVAAMTSNDEGVYTIESVTLGENGGSCGFAITGGGASWGDVNSLRYGPAVQDTKALVGVNKVDGVGDVSWAIDPGTYKMVFDYDAMTLTITQVSGGEVTPPTPDVELEPFGAMFNFDSYAGIAECVPGLPAESSWTADGTTGNIYTTAIPAEVDGVVVKPIAHSSATASNTPRYYKTAAGAYALRVYNNNTMTISAPEGGYLTSIAFTTNTVNSTISKTTVDTGVLAFDGKNFTWSPTARANISSITLSFGGTVQILTVDVTGEAPEAGTDEPTPDFPPTTWNVNGSYNDDSSWSTPITFTSYNDGVYSTDKINKLVEFKLTNEGAWYGYDGEGYAELGKTFKVAAGDQYGNVKFGLSGYVQDAVINFNPTTLEVTVDGTWVSTALELYVRGDMNNWGNDGLTDADKLSTTDGNIYTITLPSLEAGVGFKIASQSWSPEYTTNNTAMENGTYDIVSGNNMALGKSMTNVTLTLDITKKTLTVAGTESGATTLYLYGTMNEWKQSDAWKFETEDGENYTLKGVTIPAEAQMKISDAGWNNNFTYSYTGEDGIVPNTKYTLQNLTGDNENMYLAKGVTDATVNYNINSHEFEIVVEEPAELKLSFVGDNFELGNDINEYLTLTDMGVMISSGGESDGKINITSNPFSFVPNTDLGQYMLNLNYKAGYTLTAAVAPGTPEDAQIDVQNGSGNVVIAGKDLNSTLEVIVTITKDVEPSVLYLAQPFNTIPAVDPQSIEETEPGVYEGVFKFKTGMSYIGFYTMEGDVITKYSKGGFGTFPADLSAYPLTDNLVKNPAGNFSWYIPALPAGCQGNFNVTVNTNDLTITVDPIFEEAPAPENLYLWGSTNGGVRAVNMAGFVKNGNVYTLEDYEISSYGIFDTSDSEGGSTIDRGFSFFLCDNGTSFTAAGATRYYGPRATSEDEPNPAIIDLTTANNTYTATTTKSGTVDMGGNFIAINPGVYTLTFNYETKEFKAVLNDAYKQVTFEFVGEGNIADPRRYVTAINMAAEPETLELYTNTKLFSYNESAGVLFALNEGLADEYTLTVTGPTGIEQGENTYMITGSTTEGIANEMVSLLGVDNVTFTVTVGEVVDNNAYLGIAEGQVPTAPDKDYALTPDASGYVYTGTVTIQPGQSFNIWYPANILLGDENEDGENVKFQPLGPITDDEVELYFSTANTDVFGRVVPTLYGYWTLTNEEPVTINFTLDFNTFSLSLEAVNEDLPEPKATSLWFANWEMEPKKGTPANYDIEVSIKNAPEGFTYQGYQFDIALPEGLVIDTENVMANGVKASANTNDENVTTVIVYFNNDDQQTLTEEIISLPVSATYGEIEPGTYNVVISDVVFSTRLGVEFNPPVEGWTGTVTIVETEVNAESVTVESVTLDEPSFTTPSSDMVEEVTQGQSVTMTVVVEPEETTDEIDVTANNGATVTENEDGTWTVNTDDVVIPEGKDSVEVTVTVTATDSEGNVTAETEYTFTVKRILLGDSNDNGEVTVADVVTTANYIAEKPIDNFNYPNANVILNDGGITVQDVTATVNIVLGTFDGNQNPEMLQARRNARNIVTSDRLVANKVSDNKIAVSLENTYAYAALQAEIAIPEGMKVYSVTAGERAAGFEVVYNVNAEGKLIVVLYNYTNATIADGNGSIFDINVTGNGNMDNCEMINIHASDAQSNGYDLDGFVNANGATGIDGINADEEGVVYYTVDGVQVKNPEKGQILIRVANGDATKVLVK